MSNPGVLQNDTGEGATRDFFKSAGFDNSMMQMENL